MKCYVSVQVTYLLDICVISPVHMVINFKLGNISRNTFDSCEHGRENISCQDCYISLFRSIAESIYDNECPITETEIVVKDNAPWYDRELAWAKREKRRKERKWRNVRNEESRNEYRVAKNSLNSSIRIKKREH